MAILRCGLQYLSRFKFGNQTTKRSFSNDNMELSAIVKALDQIAPVNLAEKWDNVGLLVEPSDPHFVKNVMLTNDLTEDVLNEAVEEKADLIVSYHPPIFRPLKRLTVSSWKERIIVKAIENKIAVYSPHTASDAVRDGVNDWLASGIGELHTTQPITQSIAESVSNGLLHLNLHKDSKTYDHLVEDVDDSVQLLKTFPLHENSVLLLSKDESMAKMFENMQKHEIPNSDVVYIPASGTPIPNTGAGRLCELMESVPLSIILQNVKEHLKLEHLRLAVGRGKKVENHVKTIALCAGSGSGVLAGCQADVYLTGEMSHHEVLDATQNGISVILCEHSNTERGYEHVLKSKLRERFGTDKLSIIISKTDKDPLVTI